MEVDNSKRVGLFWGKVEKLDDHWLWTGALDSQGYGNFTVSKGKTGKAHRFSFFLKYGWILSHPYQIDHKCKVRNCVNPEHLRLLPGWKNNELSTSPSAINKKKTHCKRGHKYDERNTIKEKNRRRCRICEIERGRL